MAAPRKKAAAKKATPAVKKEESKPLQKLWAWRRRGMYDDSVHLAERRPTSVSADRWNYDEKTGQYTPVNPNWHEPVGGFTTHQCVSGFKKVFGWVPAIGAEPVQVELTLTLLPAAAAAKES